MSDSPTPRELADLTTRLRELSGRLARFEDVPQAELDALQADNARLLERIPRDRP